MGGRRCVCAAGGGVVVTLAGCGTPGAPQPPTLNLPEPVTDLTAVRAGNQVSLNWTIPPQNTDKLAMKNDVSVWICRKEATGPVKMWAEATCCSRRAARAHSPRRCRRLWLQVRHARSPITLS